MISEVATSERVGFATASPGAAAGVGAAGVFASADSALVTACELGLSAKAILYELKIDIDMARLVTRTLIAYPSFRGGNIMIGIFILSTAQKESLPTL